MGIVNLEAARRARRAAQIQAALEKKKQWEKRRDVELRLPPLASGYRDPDGRQTDAPDRWYFVGEETW